MVEAPVHAESASLNAPQVFNMQGLLFHPQSHPSMAAGQRAATLAQKDFNLCTFLVFLTVLACLFFVFFDKCVCVREDAQKQNNNW